MPDRQINEAERGEQRAIVEARERVDRGSKSARCAQAKGFPHSPRERREACEAKKERWLDAIRGLEAVSGATHLVGHLTHKRGLKEYAKIVCRLGPNDPEPKPPTLVLLWLRNSDRVERCRILKRLDEILELFSRAGSERLGDLGNRLVDRRGDPLGVIAEIEFVSRLVDTGVPVEVGVSEGPDFRLELDHGRYQAEVMAVGDPLLYPLSSRMGDRATGQIHVGDWRAWARRIIKEKVSKAGRQARSSPSTPTIAILADCTGPAREDLHSEWKAMNRSWNENLLCGATLPSLKGVGSVHATQCHSLVVEELESHLRTAHAFAGDIF